MRIPHLPRWFLPAFLLAMLILGWLARMWRNLS